MAKSKLSYECKSCHYQPFKWVGCCPECNEWNTIKEKAPAQSLVIHGKTPTSRLATIHGKQAQAPKRLVSSVHEWDRAVGGGVVPGSFLILTGDPGIGKSTLLLQLGHILAEQYQVLYFSSEESIDQIQRRAARIIATKSNLLLSDERNLETMLATAKQHQPALIIIDSIQNCYLTSNQTTPGTIGQLREAGFQLMQFAKEENIAVIVTGHITKDGTIAGPKTLEHMVDGVFYLQGEDRWHIRVLRSVKNRFGPLHELGFFEMRNEGLQEVPNINKELLAHSSNAPGAALISYLEGSRPLLLELQALTVATKMAIPQRVITGIDHKHVVLIAAILEKHLHIKFSNHDIFFKISGNFKVKTSGADLGIALALLSSYFQQPLPQKSIALGEMSLTGEIKPISSIAMHYNEAAKFGIEQFFTSSLQKIEHRDKTQSFRNVYELLRLFQD